MELKHCSFCGTTFNCGSVDTPLNCWCSALPNVLPAGNADCLCPECLKAQIEKLQAYDAVAAAYAQKYGDEILLKPLVQQFIADFLKPIPQNELICDMGCGPGQVARYIHQQFNRPVEGVDLSPKMIAEAQALNPGINFICADVMQFDRQYGAIIGLYFIVNFAPHHLPLLFNKLYTLFKPGGHLLLSFHIGTDDLLRVESMWDSGKPIDFYMFKTETVTKALQNAGFTIDAIRQRAPDPTVEYNSQRAYVFAIR